MRRLLSALALLLLGLPTAALADWLEASSEHFVVYANDSERDVRKFSEQLERFHAAMELVTGFETETPSPSNRVTVFMVSSQSEIQRLAGSRNVGGFYIPRAGRSSAFVPRVEVKTGQPDYSMIALLHEYAHHFLLSNSQFPSPRWFGEGGAEFFASAEFTADGGLGIGMPAQHRGWELLLARNVKAKELVDTDTGRRDSYDAFYGKSWLLYHYLVFSTERRGQMRSYLQGMAAGKTSLQAAQEAFGDLDQLERELQRYLDQRTMLSMRYRPDQLVIAPITVRAVSEGEGEMMQVRIRSVRGVDREEALELLTRARRIAARFPEDPAVLSALSEAEYDAGNDAEAIAAADHALSLDPGQVNAYVQKGYALFRQAEATEGEGRAAAYREAMKPFSALNQRENDHPLPLVYYFRSFAERGVRPSEQAVLGLTRATELAPFDLGLRVNLATYQIQAGELAAARANLVPVAYNPHGDAMADAARQVVERIDAGGEPSAPELLALLRPAPTEAAASSGGGD